MPLTERFKPVIAKAHKAIFIADDKAFDVTKFNVLDDLIKALSLVVESGTNIFYSLIHLDPMIQTIRAQRFFLHRKVAFLRRRGETSIRWEMGLSSSVIKDSPKYDELSIVSHLFEG